MSNNDNFRELYTSKFADSRHKPLGMGIHVPLKFMFCIEINCYSLSDLSVNVITLVNDFCRPAIQCMPTNIVMKILSYK